MTKTQREERILELSAIFDAIINRNPSYDEAVKRGHAYTGNEIVPYMVEALVAGEDRLEEFGYLPEFLELAKDTAEKMIEEGRKLRVELGQRMMQEQMKYISEAEWSRIVD